MRMLVYFVLITFGVLSIKNAVAKSQDEVRHQESDVNGAVERIRRQIGAFGNGYAARRNDLPDYGSLFSI